MLNVIIYVIAVIIVIIELLLKYPVLLIIAGSLILYKTHVMEKFLSKLVI